MGVDALGNVSIQVPSTPFLGKSLTANPPKNLRAWVANRDSTLTNARRPASTLFTCICQHGFRQAVDMGKRNGRINCRRKRCSLALSKELLFSDVWTFPRPSGKRRAEHFPREITHKKVPVRRPGFSKQDHSFCGPVIEQKLLG